MQALSVVLLIVVFAFLVFECVSLIRAVRKRKETKKRSGVSADAVDKTEKGGKE